MGRISDAISEYQQIIGAYDRQLWDRSIEASVRKGLKNVARKTAKVNPDLIDVDLVRGSTFSKPKPEHGWFGVSWRAVPRVLFLPLYYRWWKKSTSVRIYCLLSFLYVMQVLTFSLYVLDSDGLHLDAESLSLAHLLTPCILMFVLAFIHTQIMATYVSLKKSRNTRETVEGSKETGEVGADGSEHDSVGSQDTGIDLNPDDVHMKYRPNSVKFAGCRRRSRSSVPVLEVPVTSDNLRNVADADDEADEPSTVGKTSDVERRQSTRSASFDKTVEWLLTQTGAQDRSDEYHGAEETSAQNCCQQIATVDTEADCTIRDETTNQVIKSVSQADLSSVEPILLSSPAHSWTQVNPPAATASADGINTAGVRRRVINRHVLDLNECLVGDAENDASKRRRQLTTQDSRQTFASLGISSGDSEADINTRRHNRSKLWCVRACSHDAHKSSTLCDRRSSADVATSEWEYNVNTDMTSCDSTPSGSGSDVSENDATAANTPRHGPTNVPSSGKDLSLNSDRVSCMIWESGEAQKVDLTVLDIGWKIIERVDKLMSEEPCNYFVAGICFSVLLMFVPVVYRLYHTKDQLESLDYQAFEGITSALQLAFGHNWRQSVVIINGLIQRFCLSVLLFFLLTVAERTFQQRLLYAKNFCYLTSSHRAKKYNLPHFRLNKVRTIRSWLSLRSFLKRRGPQRSVENIVSAAFLVMIVLISILCIELLQDAGIFLDHLGNWELVIWSLAIGVFLMRFITLGTNINRKYRNFSVLITEQINLYLHMEQKPHKKEDLMIANSVLKLAENLLKELESPFRISGLSANPLLYNIMKVVILSAFSAVLTELLGFKLKLYKIKIRA